MRKSWLQKEISHPLFHNLFLLGIIFFAAWAILIARDNNVAKFQIILISDIFYFIWGLIYHVSKKDLTFKIFLEYALFAILILLIAQAVFFWR